MAPWPAAGKSLGTADHMRKERFSTKVSDDTALKPNPFFPKIPAFTVFEEVCRYFPKPILLTSTNCFCFSCFRTTDGPFN